MPSRPAIDAELLEGLARLLQSTGVTPAAQLKTFRRICGQLQNHPTPTYRQHLKNLPQIIGEWYRNPAYLDARGAPRPLRRSGRRSLMALAEQVLPDTDPAVALAALEHNRAIRPTRTGWVPTGKRIVYVDEDVRAHALEALRSLLSTLEQIGRAHV